MAFYNEIVKAIQQLNQVGEVPLWEGADFLFLRGYLQKADEKYVITRKWCDMACKLGKDDLSRAFLAQQPEVWSAVLARTQLFANEIVNSGDLNGLFYMVNRLPKLAGEVKKVNGIFDLQVLTQLFNCVPDYSMLMQLLENIQKADDFVEPQIKPIGNTPDENWVPDRKVATSFEMAVTENQYILAPFNYKGSAFSQEIASLLGNPWETFMILLGMLHSEFIVAHQEVFTLIPQNATTAREMQEVEVKMYTLQGREFNYGNLNRFGEDLALELGLDLFPDKQPPLVKALFKLIEKGIFEYRGNVYRLTEKWVAKIYCSERVLVVNSHHLREKIKEKLEKIRNRK